MIQDVHIVTAESLLNHVMPMTLSNLQGHLSHCKPSAHLTSWKYSMCHVWSQLLWLKVMWATILFHCIRDEGLFKLICSHVGSQLINKCIVLVTSGIVLVTSGIVLVTVQFTCTTDCAV